MNPFRVVPAGDSVLVVEFEERIDPAVNARTIAVADKIQAAALSGVRDVVPRTHAGIRDVTLFG